MNRSLCLVLLVCACGGEGVDLAAQSLLQRTAKEAPPRERRLACIDLGRVGGVAARDRLLELLTEVTGVAERDGPLHLYAAVGLTLRRDPGTAIDLLNALNRLPASIPKHLVARSQLPCRNPLVTANSKRMLLRYL